MASPLVTPAVQRRPMHRTCDASSLSDGANLTEAGRQGRPLRMWLADILEAFIRRTQGGYVIAKGVTNDALSRSVDTTPRPLSCHPISKARGKGRLDAQRAKEGWRVRWKQVISVPTSRSPLMKIFGRIVARAQWEVVTGLGILAFVASSVIVGVLVVITVP